MDLELEKSETTSYGTQAPSPGDTIIWTLTYTNSGDTAAPNTILSETVPGFTTFNDGDSTGGWLCADGSPAGTLCLFPVGQIFGGSGATVDFAVDVIGSYAGEQIVNTASIDFEGTDVNPQNNSATSTVGPEPTHRVPEPGTLALFGLGLAALGFARRRKEA